MGTALGMLAASLLFGGASFFYFRYPDALKRWADNASPLELQRRINKTVSLSTYRLAAWIFALCSAAMLLGAALQLAIPS